MTTETATSELLITLTADIISAHVSHNSIPPAELPAMIRDVHRALNSMHGFAAPQVETKLEPAVSPRSSIKPDYIVCLEDGKKLKMLKRHLMTQYNLTPEQYRAKWQLPADYPMVAPNYAEQRRVLAKQIGLGKRPGKR